MYTDPDFADEMHIEAERMRVLSEDEQRTVIAGHRAVAANRKLLSKLRAESALRADTLEAILGLAR